MIRTITLNGSRGAAVHSEQRKQVFTTNRFLDSSKCRLGKHFGNPATEFLVESAFGNDPVGALCQTVCLHFIRVIGRDYDDTGCGMVFADERHALESVDASQLEIDQH